MIQTYAADMIHELLNAGPMMDLCVDGFSTAQLANVQLQTLPAENGIRHFQRQFTIDGLQLEIHYKVYEADQHSTEAIEVAATLHNNTNSISPEISNIQFLHVHISDSPNATAFRKRSVMYAKGSHADIEDFHPHICESLNVAINPIFTLDSVEERSSSAWMPYMNFRQGETEGVFFAVGWSGHWAAQVYSKDRNTEVTLRYDCSFRLNPGESIALPSALILPWSLEVSDEEVPESFNMFRRFIKNRILPKQNGKPIEGQVCLRAWGDISPEEHKIRWENMKKYGLTCDAYGVDAGWYALDADVPNRDWYTTVGEWEEDPKVFPDVNGIGSMAEGGRQAGAKGFWLWFEFERAVRQSKAVQEHPELYLLNPTNETDNLIDMRNPNARAFITEKLRKIIEKTGLTIFRIDFNLATESVFSANERLGNKGLVELQYYNGLYSFFQDFLAAFPHVIIDNCGAGGRRLDYRMQSFSIPIMCRSDYFTLPIFAPEGQQAQTLASARWLPVSGDSCGSCMGTTNILFDTYRVRSAFGSGIGLAAPNKTLTEAEGKWWNSILKEAHAVTPYMSKDFYPLTGYSILTRDWCAWECCDESKEDGMIMAFRREHSATSEQTYELHGVDRDASYVVRDISGQEIGVFAGSDLAEGYAVKLPQKRSSCIHFYHRL